MIRHSRLVLSVVAVALVATACASSTVDEGEQAAVVHAADGAGEDVAADDAVVDQVADDATAADAPAGADDGADGDTSVVETPADESTDAAAAVEALWWSAETVDGTAFAAADLAGEDVVLWMWAPWCSVCNREAPEVARAIADLPDDVTIVGVAGRDDVGPMQDFIAEHGLQGITHVVDADGAVWASYGISYQPAWVFIDETGAASVAAGALGYDGIFAGIAQVFGS